MSIPEPLRTAVASADPLGSLRRAVVELRESGHSRADVSDWLNELLLTVRRAEPDSAGEEAILATLDAVEGWCHPSARLFPEPVA